LLYKVQGSEVQRFRVRRFRVQGSGFRVNEKQTGEIRKSIVEVDFFIFRVVNLI